MAHFAELDENNIVIQVVVVDDLDTRDENNDENEAVGIHFLRNILVQQLIGNKLLTIIILESNMQVLV